MPQLITYRAEKAELLCQGDWTIDTIAALEQIIDALLAKVDNAVTINGQGITKMDSAGGMVLLQLQNKLHEFGKSAIVQSLHHDFQALLSLIETGSQTDQLSPKKSRINVFPPCLEKLSSKLNECLNFIAFLGHFAVILVKSLRQFHAIKWRSVFSVIDSAGFQALPIVALLTFLVGIVMTYQIALQLSTYGANIYIVDVTGIIVFREFAPLITAIIAAGRTSTSFAAQIGTMKVNEEIDALQTMGIPAFVRIVLPKVFGLVIALPLLVVWSDVFGVLGTMVMSKSQLGISYQTFLMRFEHVISVQQYVIGLIKVPFFALVIALVGSYQGFQVAHNADSVGKNNKSAVQSIFLIIIVDALFPSFLAFGNLMEAPVIEIQQLKTELGGAVIHHDLDLSIQRKEIIAIVGASGCGKTTLIRAMLMLLRPNFGSIKVFGTDILRCNAAQACAVRKRWGVMFQSGALFSSLTVLENIIFPMSEAVKLPQNLMKQLALFKLNLVGLPTDAASKYPSELSGGMRKRVALARAFGVGSPVGFLDEPTAGLDPQSSDAFDELVLQLHRLLGITLIIITHDLDTLWRVPNRVVFLGEGQVLAACPMPELVQHSHPLIKKYFSGPRGQQKRSTGK